ncbi:MAG: S1/P1 nuclease [Alphaproteobacteria bacterium]|nr:S1/P1 nuclease [Alphaproteobacteria bacterium]MBV9372600.1 S1/P1 nuclease [Alphaproteobacteria bacterium]MBV9900990.1 S1/P1 nuclease [Alphaproteobacteria bacterium]
MPRPARFALAVAALAALASSSSAFAWGKTGHRTVAAIADRGLSAEARAHVRLLLGSESLDEAATWPDDMRSDPDPFWQATATPWHYVTVGGSDYDAAPPEGDAVTALRHFRAVLLDPRASLAEKQTALRFIVHLVGDLHQPLHAGAPGDRGGNAVKVTFAGKPTNLHSVWDSGLVDDEQLSFTELAERLERRTTPEEVIAWSDPDPLDWIRESVAIRPSVYPQGTTELGWDYIYKFRPVMERRLQQGGVRLAAYLNDLYAARRTPEPPTHPGGRTRRHRRG